VSRLFTLKERQGLAKPQSPQSTASFFFVKKKVVVAFLCVLAPLREPPFHAKATARSRKGAKAQSTPVSSLSRRRSLLPFFASWRLCVSRLFTLFLNVSHLDLQ
jgi:hypothetical protein